jgi:hypothetical protein
MKILSHLTSAAVMAFLLATQTGCLFAAGAAGAVAVVKYLDGDLDASVDAPPVRTVEAAKMAMQELQIKVATAQSSSLDGQLVAYTATDTKVKIKVNQLTEQSSKVTIRVGTWGDKDMSLRILEKIKAHLQTPVP